jgi:hypothetical protein
MQAPRSSEK